MSNSPTAEPIVLNSPTTALAAPQETTPTTSNNDNPGTANTEENGNNANVVTTSSPTVFTTTNSPTTPTTMPTVAATTIPPSMPSAAPSAEPTTEPTSAPSATLSVQPSVTPTKVPKTNGNVNAQQTIATTNELSITIEIITDFFPQELSYQLYYYSNPEQQDPILVDELDFGVLKQSSTAYYFSYYIQDILAADTPQSLYDGSYGLNLLDLSKDGFCCDHGQGSVRIYQTGADSNSNALSSGRQLELAYFNGNFTDAYEVSFKLWNPSEN